MKDFKRKNKQLNIPFDNLEKANSSIVIGKNSNSFLTTNENRVLILDKDNNNDFLNANIEVISSSIDKPSIIVFDDHKELYNYHYDLLKRRGYEVNVLNIDKINFDLFTILNVLLHKIKELELWINNDGGKYYYKDESYLSYNDIRVKITALKDELIFLTKKIIDCLYDDDEINNELILISLLIFYEKIIYQDLLEEINETNFFEFIINLFDKKVPNIKREINSSNDDDFKVKERLVTLKIKNDDLEKRINRIKQNTTSLWKIYETQNLYLLDKLNEKKKILYITGTNQNNKALFLYLLNYLQIESNIYLLIKDNQVFNLNNEFIKTIWIINNTSDLIDYSPYKIKVFRGKPTSNNKKEVLTICKKEINEVLTKEYYKIIDLLKIFDSLNYDLNDILIIHEKEGNKIESFVKGKSYQKNLITNYRKKEI
ncbi:MAG: hypothetical protein IJX78_02725 [Bacilli bacterium]|nr:hypothetical protein [Bacilli bacterium]